MPCALGRIDDCHDGTSNMFGAKTGVATHINKTESHAHLTYYHDHTL